MPHPHLEYEHIVEQTIFSRVRGLLAEKFGVTVTNVELDSALVADLGIEPADIEYFALALEATFDVEISADNATQLVKVRDAVRCVLGARTQLQLVAENVEPPEAS